MRRLLALARLGIGAVLHYLVLPLHRRGTRSRHYVARFLPDNLLPTRPASRDLMVQASRCTGCGLCDARCVLEGRLPLGHPRPSFIPRALVRSLPDLAAARGDLTLFRKCGDCRACETWCPVDVPLQALLDDATALLDRLDRRKAAA